MVIVLTLHVQLDYNEMNARELKTLVNTKGLIVAANTLAFLKATITAGSDEEISDLMEGK